MALELFINIFRDLPPALSTGCGVFGFVLYLTNYTMVTFRVIDSQGIAFFVINIAAASLVLISLAQNFNLGSALIQGFWICLGVVAVIIRLRTRAVWRRCDAELKGSHRFPAQ